MGRRKKYSKKIPNIVYILITIFIAFSVYVGSENFQNNNSNNLSPSNETNVIQDSKMDITVDSELKIYYLNVGHKIYYLNVGQADSILIQNEGQNMLIDAGNNADGENIVEFLQSLNISKIDFLVGTHPHEDHIGGLDDIINNFDIGTIYMPKVATTTKTFEDVLDAIQAKSLFVTTPEIGKSFNMGSANFQILSAGTDEEDLNSCSIVLKLTFGNLAYLFTGDEETVNEEQMISSGYDLSADVLKVAHHGSNTSTSEEFLNKVSPDVAIIMVGRDNSYGHPHSEVLNRLESKNIKIYRTDTDGTILITSDGNKNNIQTLTDMSLNG